MFEVDFAGLNELLRRHFAAHGGTGAVGGEQRLHRYLENSIFLKVANLRGIRGEIRALEAMLEMQLHSGLAGRRFDQYLVEAMPGNRINHLVLPLPVGLECSIAVLVVNEPAAHGQQGRRHCVEHACRFERMDSAVGQRQVDGAARACGEPS